MTKRHKGRLKCSGEIKRDSHFPPLSMDTAFHLDEGSRANFLRLVMQSFGCFYICLWSYMPPPSNCLFFLDGVYDEENQPSSSSGSLARRLFDEYRLSVFKVFENECVPGFAFRNSISFVELQEMDLQRLASDDKQRQFYQEARIKTAVFMGCKSGEIELGMSNVCQINIKREMMRTWLPEVFPGQLSPHTEVASRSINGQQQYPLSSSSSSLRSLSTMDSPEYSSLLFNIPTTTTTISHNIPELFTQLSSNPLQPINISSLEPLPTKNLITTTSSTSTTSPHQQAIQAISRIRNIQFPTPEIEDATMTRAILAVLSSSPYQPPPQTNPPSSSSTTDHHLQTPRASAFKSYNTSVLAPRTQMSANLRQQNMHKRSISFLRSLNLTRLREGIQATRPTSSQLHHMISERKRREKLNESFHTLKSLLPPGTKKDKASVLTTAREYLTSLKAQVAELSKRNQQLEARLLPLASLGANEAAAAAAGSSNERCSLTVTRVSTESSPDQDEQIIDLQVILRSQESCTEDMVIRILEFLKRVENVSLMSMEANTWISESNFNINRVILRLRVDQGTEWDEAAFQEAVRRVVADLVRRID
ncbi:putative transcription factor bHLH041 isoform X1 [Malus domestica]|uniref:putative transcription factor bHLH041 isoform X1 n=1 Tax=Malus domestica TaxID=3750 RepID=UPI0007ED30BA|nr:putative transcription factor bHLH041 isoform X1 [Malus domestica]